MHLNTGNNHPGISGLVAYNPETRPELANLAQKLMRTQETSFSEGERELLAAFVSKQNNCNYFFQLHKSIAALYLGAEIVEKVLSSSQFNALSQKMNGAFYLASLVTATPYSVTAEAVNVIRSEGLTDKDIHDVILITAATSMFNRYVSAAGAADPDLSPEAYQVIAEQFYYHGYAS